MSTFKREDRYIVIKRSDVETFWRDDVREQFMSALKRLNEHDVRTPQRKYLVIESDWPEFEPAYQMIEDRMTGQPGRDALLECAQGDLRQAVQIIEKQKALLHDWYAANAEGRIQVDDDAYHIVVSTAQLIDGAEVSQ